MTTPDRAHQHTNPSPSLGVGAWCNGSPENPGCGHFAPLDSFTAERASYFDPYLIDRRTLSEWVEQQIARINRSSFTPESEGALRAFERMKKKIGDNAGGGGSRD